MAPFDPGLSLRLDLEDSRFEFCVVRFEGYASERELE
jgi:hypothetical protein